MAADIILTPDQANALETFRRSHSLALPEELHAFRLADVAHALSGGYRIGKPDMPAVLKPRGILAKKPDGALLTPEQVVCIEHWFMLFGSTRNKPYFLKQHQDMRDAGGWTDPRYHTLNRLDPDELGLALFHGYRLT